MCIRRKFTVASIIGILFIASANAQDAEPGKPAELRVLERYVGTWEETVITKPALWTPERATSTTTSTRRWILNRTIIENKGAWSGSNMEFLHLMTFDPKQKEYCQWYFDKDNAVPQMYRGTWDEKTQTFTFTGTLAGGIQSNSKQRFIDNDTFTWTMVAKDQAGKVVLDIEGKCVRKK